MVLSEAEDLSTPTTTIFRTLFQVPYTLSPLFATLTKTAGVYPLSSQFGTDHPMRMQVPPAVFLTGEPKDLSSPRTIHHYPWFFVFKHLQTAQFASLLF